MMFSFSPLLLLGNFRREIVLSSVKNGVVLSRHVQYFTKKLPSDGVAMACCCDAARIGASDRCTHD